MRLPSGLGMTTGSPPSIAATTELVVPSSIPIIVRMPLVRTSRRLSRQKLYNDSNIECERQDVKLWWWHSANLVDIIVIANLPQRNRSAAVEGDNTAPPI